MLLLLTIPVEILQDTMILFENLLCILLTYVMYVFISPSKREDCDQPTVISQQRERHFKKQ